MASTKQMQLGEPTSDDVWELTDAERQAMGIQPLPESLDEALKVMEKSDFVASVLGEHAFEYFLRNKRQEWEEYRKQGHSVRIEEVLAEAVTVSHNRKSAYQKPGCSDRK